MEQKAEIKRKIFGKNGFQNVVDTQFKQLIKPEDTTEESIDADISKFFQTYDDLFYDIPVSGSANSHLELVTRSSDYIGLSLADLQEELANLREENVSLKNQLFVLSQNI